MSSNLADSSRWTGAPVAMWRESLHATLPPIKGTKGPQLALTQTPALPGPAITDRWVEPLPTTQQCEREQQPRDGQTWGKEDKLRRKLYKPTWTLLGKPNWIVLGEEKQDGWIKITTNSKLTIDLTCSCAQLKNC